MKIVVRSQTKAVKRPCFCYKVLFIIYPVGK